MMVRLFVAGLFMAAAALILVQIGKTKLRSLEVGQTMAPGRPVTDEHLPRAQPALSRGERLRCSTLLQPDAASLPSSWAVIGTILITETRILTSLFHTVSLTIDQWLICLVPGVILLILGELFKVVLRARRPHEEPTTGEVAAPASR